MRLIDADKLVEKCKEHREYLRKIGDDNYKAWEDCLFEVVMAPTEMNNGKWKKISKYWCICSSCKCYSVVPAPHCPWCGCSMDDE